MGGCQACSLLSPGTMAGHLLVAAANLLVLCGVLHVQVAISARVQAVAEAAVGYGPVEGGVGQQHVLVVVREVGI